MGGDAERQPFLLLAGREAVGVRRADWAWVHAKDRKSQKLTASGGDCPGSVLFSQDDSFLGSRVVATLSSLSLLEGETMTEN